MRLDMALWRNPLLVKHRWSRLRRQHLVPSVLAVLITCCFIMWWASSTDSLTNGYAFWALVVLQSFLLFLVGTSEVATAVERARDSGVLDFHRIAPEPPLATVIGFILGAPIREYVLVAYTLPFSLICVLMGSPGFLGFCAVLVVLVAASLLYHSVAALAALSAPKPRGVGKWIVALVAIVHVGSAVDHVGLVTIVPTCRQVFAAGTELSYRVEFFGLEASPFLLTLLHLVPLVAFVLVAAVRCVRRETSAPFSKPMAVVVHAIASFLILGDVWSAFGLEYRTAAAVYGSVLIGVAMCAASTPSAGAFAKGVRRARKAERSGASWWDDAAANWASVGALCGVVVVTGTMAWVTEVELYTRPTDAILSVVIGTCVTAYFGWALQFAVLKYPRAAQHYFALFLFVAWGLPLAAAGILAVSYDESFATSVGALSPIMGIGIADGWLSALTSSIGWAVVFGFLAARGVREAALMATAPPIITGVDEADVA